MSTIRSIRADILRTADETVRFYKQHGARNGWSVPSPEAAMKTAKQQVLTDAARHQRALIAAGEPVNSTIVKLVLAAYERGLIRPFGRDADTLRNALVA